MRKMFAKIWKSVAVSLVVILRPGVTLRLSKGDTGLHAETLIEVIIAVSVLVTIMGPATGMIVSSTRNTAYNRNRLIAESLTEEGIELMVGIRDTNLLRFSPKAKDCWDTKATHNALDTCHNNKIDTSNKCRIAVDPRPNVESFVSLECTAQTELTEGLTEAGDAYYQLRVDPDTGIYHHIANVGQSVNFYRSIKIEKFDLWNPAGGAVAGNDAMKVTSIVVYRSGSEVKKVKRILILTRQPV